MPKKIFISKVALQTALTFKLQAAATLNQAAPVQNTWYTALDTKTNCRLLGVGVSIADTDETLSAKMTIDGQILTNSLGCTAGTVYWFDLYGYANQMFVPTFSTTRNPQRAFYIEGRSVKVEVRKTTAAGAGTLSCTVIYQLRD